MRCAKPLDVGILVLNVIVSRRAWARVIPGNSNDVRGVAILDLASRWFRLLHNAAPVFPERDDTVDFGSGGRVVGHVGAGRLARAVWVEWL